MDTAATLTEQREAAIRLRCRCCRSNEAVFLGTRKGRFVKQPFRFYLCNSCGFQFVEPVIDSAVYDDGYYAGKGPDPTVNYEREYHDYATDGRILELEDVVQIARANLEASKKTCLVEWLDFGCGAGGLLRYLRENKERIAIGPGGLSLFGHDVGSYAERLARIDGFKILSRQDLAGMHGVFDVISCLEVLEHLPSPVPVLKLLGRLLKPGGLLILTTGNMHSPAAKWRGIHFSYCIPEIHVSLFNPTLLAKLYQQAGLTPFKVKFRGAIVFRILKRLRLSWPRRLLSPVAHLNLIISLADFVYGTSAMPCARKPLRAERKQCG